MADYIAGIQAKYDEGRPIISIEVKYLLDRLAESQRREKAAVEDLIMACNQSEKIICGQLCKRVANGCFVRAANGGKYECANFKWRGPVAEEGNAR